MVNSSVLPVRFSLSRPTWVCCSPQTHPVTPQIFKPGIFGHKLTFLDFKYILRVILKILTLSLRRNIVNGVKKYGSPTVLVQARRTCWCSDIQHWIQWKTAVQCNFETARKHFFYLFFKDIKIIKVSVRILHANLKMSVPNICTCIISQFQLCTFWPPCMFA